MYRDDLGAAHLRIAQLEREVKDLQVSKKPVCKEEESDGVVLEINGVSILNSLGMLAALVPAVGLLVVLMLLL
jgi:hypothetical protein